MATLPQQIAQEFLAQLAESNVDVEKIERLRAVLADGRKLKADELVEMFSLPAGGDLK